MRIALKVGSTYYPLAGESGVDERTHTSAADFEIVAKSEVQVIARVRASHVQIVDRGNIMHTVRFTTTRQLATPAAAFLSTIDMDGAIPRTGILVMDAVAPNGGIYRRLMASAVVTPPSRRVIGATAFFDYTVDGGEITDGGYIAPGLTPATGSLTFTANVTSYLCFIGGLGFSASFSGVSTTPEAAALVLRDSINASALSEVIADVLGGVVYLTAKTAGAAGNSITLSVSSSNLTRSAATLTGGVG